MSEKNYSKGLLPLAMVEILRKYTDPEHHLYQGVDKSADRKEDTGKYVLLQNILLEEYNLNVDRKTISRNLKRLRDEVGMDITITDKDGVWLNSRDFQENELKLLINSVLSNRYLSVEETRDLSERIRLLGGDFFGFDTSNVVVIDEKNKYDNENVFENFEIINKALESGKPISFRQKHYIDGKYKLSPPNAQMPWSILFMNQRYYMVCKKGDNVGYYPLDQMYQVTLTQDKTDRLKTKKITKQEKAAIRKAALTTMPSGLKQEWFRFYAPVGMIDMVKETFGEEGENLVIRETTNDLHGERHDGGKHKEWNLSPSRNAPYMGYLLDISVNTNAAIFRRFFKQHFNVIEVVSTPEIANWAKMQLVEGVRKNVGDILPIRSISDEDQKVLSGLSLESKIKLHIPIQFGNYPFTKEGEEKPIDWLPLECSNNTVLLISRYCLDYADLREELRDARLNDPRLLWKNTSLKKWLNEYFVKAAFSDKEYEKLVSNIDGEKVSILNLKHLRSSDYVMYCNYIDMTDYTKKKWMDRFELTEDSLNEEQMKLVVPNLKTYQPAKMFWGIDDEDEMALFTELSPTGMRAFHINEAGIRPVICIRKE